MQSKLGSAVEAIANVVVGIIVSLISQLVIFGAYGIHISLVENMQMVGYFTLISLVRSYLLRRLFNRLHAKNY